MSKLERRKSKSANKLSGSNLPEIHDINGEESNDKNVSKFKNN